MKDLISRQAAIKAFYIQSDDDGWWVGTAQDAETLLNGLPTAERAGKWIETSSGDHWKCSRCNCRAGFWFNEENSCEWSMDMSEWLSDYCPNCGARMRGEEE